MRPISIESTLLLFLLTQNFLGLKHISKRWKNCFLWKGYSRYWHKIVSTSQNEGFLSKLRFYQRKNLAKISKKQVKKRFHQLENQFPLAGIRLFFKYWIFRFPKTGKKKSLNKRILFQLDRSRFPLAGMENSFNNTFLLDEKTASIDRNIQKIKENGCQWQ